MQRKLQIITTASLMMITALAQDNHWLQTHRPVYVYERFPRTRSDCMNAATKINEIIGMTIKNYQAERLGKVVDLSLDVESGRIVQVFISTGGFLGGGDRVTAVPPGALHHDLENRVLHLDANKEKLKSAPEFQSARWAGCSDKAQLASTYTYFGQEAALNFLSQDTSPESTADATPTRNPDGTWKRIRLPGDDKWSIPASRLHQLQMATKLTAFPVMNHQHEKLGNVDNLLVDMQSARIVALVVSSGGFLGISDELSAVPPTALRFNTERDSLQLDTTKELLSAAPHFKPNQWPDFTQPEYARGVYLAYNVEPYFRTEAPKDTDKAHRQGRDRADQPSKTAKLNNTERNVRDRYNRTLTPFDQGNSQADTDTTSQIRKGIIVDKNMSVNARNVKVITLQGRVTLRGPVNTAEEGRRIGEIASKIAKLENVDNQLEVK